MDYTNRHIVQNIGELTINASCGAELHAVTVVTDGASGTVAPHKNMGLFEYNGTLMGLDWVAPPTTLPLFKLDATPSALCNPLPPFVRVCGTGRCGFGAAVSSFP